MPNSDYYRKDSSNGITPPNPDAEKDLIQHITKHRGQKTPYTSVSESPESIRRFEGVLYKTSLTSILADNHAFKSHSNLIQELQGLIGHASDKTTIVRALMLAKRAREALIDWDLRLSKKKSKHILEAHRQVQKYFQKV